MGFTRLFKWFLLWRKRRLVGTPVNVIGPFVFPAPDDARWVGKRDNLVSYELDVVKCFMYSNHGGGFVMVGVTLLTDVNEDYMYKGSRYAVAVAKAYGLAHPEWHPIELLLDKERQIIAHLSRINSTRSQSGNQERNP